jgi:hypothetical protein
MCLWFSLKYTQAIDMNFGYVALYGMYRSVTKFGFDL